MKVYSSEECAILKDLYLNKNMTMKQIAEELGIAVGKVHKMIHYFEIDINRKDRKPFSDERRKECAKRATGRIFSEETRKKISEARKMHKIGHAKERKDGYIQVYFPDHPQSSKDGYVMEHRLIMENLIGRYLNDDEVVHHKNHIRNDNRIANLQLMTFKEHAALHMKERYKKENKT